jgi:hypothetical protein
MTEGRTNNGPGGPQLAVNAAFGMNFLPSLSEHHEMCSLSLSVSLSLMPKCAPNAMI